MIKPPDSVKRYASAKDRFLKPLIMNFFASECPRFFGPVMREKLAEELIGLFEAVAPETTRVKPGQMLWNALDKNTRGDSPHRRYVPVVLTVIDEDDVEQLVQGTPISQVSQQAVARMLREAYRQDGLLSSRDLGLITLRGHVWASLTRRRYEAQHDCILPHTGALHDMGSTVSHKKAIVRKTILEKKDPAAVAQECCHSQGAVDRYLKDYHRVKTLYKLNQDVDFIHLATQIARHVVVQYIDLIHQEEEPS